MTGILRVLLAAVALFASESLLSRTVSAQSLSLKVCTRTFGAWVEARDASLQRLEASPTLLGMDNTWCAASPGRVADLKAELARVRLACAGLGDDEAARIEALIVRAAHMLDRVRTCAASATVTAAADDAPWQTSVRASPAPAAKEKPKKAQMITAAGPVERSGLGGDVPPAARAETSKKPRVKVAEALVPPTPAQAGGEPDSPRAFVGSRSDAADVPPVTIVSRVAAAALASDAPRSATNGSPKTASARDIATPPVRRPAVSGLETSALGEPEVVSAKPEAKKVAAGSDAAGKKAKTPPPQAGGASDDECLVVTRTSLASYLIENQNCKPQSVLTTIALQRSGRGVRCFTKRIATQIAIAGEYGVEPQINFQCREGAKGCVEDMLRDMFPECQPG